MLNRGLLLAATSILFIGCAHYPDVRPGEEEHKVVVSEDTEAAGFKNAMNQAKDYCSDAHGDKKPVVVKEDKKYTGSMDEETYKTTKTASKVAGGLASMLGGDRVSKAGDSASNLDLGKPYQITLVFKCK